MKKVSIIIPIYNVEKYIRRCLDSVLNQSYSNIEVICVDDCGTDDSMQIVRKYKEMYPQVMTIIESKQNVGLGGARDKGLDVASGEYISFIDSDDYIKTDFIERYMSEAANGEPDIIMGGYIRNIQGKQKIFFGKPDEEDIWVNVSAWTKVYKKSFLAEHKLDFCGIRRYEDEGFCYRILLNKPKVACISYAGYFYCLNPNSITKSKSVDRSKIFIEYVEQVDELWTKISKDNSSNAVLKYVLASGLIANLLYNGQGCGKKKMQELYKRYRRTLNRIDADITNNKCVRLKYLKKEPAKKRYATWLILNATKIKCDKIFFLFDSIL